MFAVWLIPVLEDEQYLGEIARKLSKLYEAPKFQPHITIYGLIDAKFEIVKNAVIKSVADVEPFTVKTTGLSYSDDIWKSVFVNIESNKNLNLIHERLSDNLGMYSKYNFIPHLSLIYKKIDESEKKKIIDNIRLKKELGIDKISILKFSEDISKWKIIEVLKL